MYKLFLGVLLTILVSCSNGNDGNNNENINECLTNKHNCQAGFECEDTIEGFICNDVSSIFVDCENGNDENTGDKENPKKTVQNAINSLNNKNKIKVAKGICNESIDLISNFSLLGGYVNNFEQTELNSTTIQATKTEAPFPYPNYALYAGKNVENVTIENFTIKGTTGIVSSGIFCEESEITIKNNIIYGGESDNTIGIYNVNASPTIDNNIIHGGSGRLSSKGILNFNCQSIIKNNFIETNDGNGDYSNVIYNEYSEDFIYNNVLIGGKGYKYSTGISNFTNSSPKIYNNIINGGGGITASVGVYNYNNSNPYIKNNIVFTTGGVEEFCLYEGGKNDANWTLSNPNAVENNDLFNCKTALYSNFDGDVRNNILDINDINNYLNTVQFADKTSKNNISINPYFINDIIDDYHFSQNSPIEVTEGGVDLTNENISADKDGKERTNPFSIGCFEK